MTLVDEMGLMWWRTFLTKIEPGSDMPKPLSALLGHRFRVICTTEDD